MNTNGQVEILKSEFERLRGEHRMPYHAVAWPAEGARLTKEAAQQAASIPGGVNHVWTDGGVAACRIAIHRERSLFVHGGDRGPIRHKDAGQAVFYRSGPFERPGDRKTYEDALAAVWKWANLAAQASRVFTLNEKQFGQLGLLWELPPNGQSDSRLANRWLAEVFRVLDPPTEKVTVSGNAVFEDRQFDVRVLPYDLCAASVLAVDVLASTPAVIIHKTELTKAHRQHDRWREWPDSNPPKFKAIQAIADYLKIDRTTVSTGIKPDAEGPGRAYLERPRGHSKTSDLAIQATWALAFAPSKIVGAAAAGSRDQARLLRNAADTLLRLNPLLRETLSIQNYRILNDRTGSELNILAADPGTQYGLLLDFLLADELTHWPTGGEQLWDTLVSTISKRARCFSCVISNAGWGRGTSWQWNAREACRTDPAWYFSKLDGPQAIWITKGTLAEQQRLLPPSAYARLWQNRWTAETGDCLSESDVR